jgi:hypothetical protein
MQNNNTLVNYNTEQETDMWKLQMSMAKNLMASKAIPASIENEAQALAIIQYGRELGYPPMMALQNISLIKGRPTLSANLIGARLKNAGYDYNVGKWDEKTCTIEFVKPSGGKFTYTYTLEDAKGAGLTAKDNWRRMPKDMLFARCISKGGRAVAPEILMGVYEQTEVQESDVAKEMTDKVELDAQLFGEEVEDVKVEEKKEEPQEEVAEEEVEELEEALTDKLLRED